MVEFQLFNKDCPWFNENKCYGQVSYNQHVNDKHYADCSEYGCPIFYWINVCERIVNVNVNNS